MAMGGCLSFQRHSNGIIVARKINTLIKLIVMTFHHGMLMVETIMTCCNECMNT